MTRDELCDLIVYYDTNYTIPPIGVYNEGVCNRWFLEGEVCERTDYSKCEHAQLSDMEDE